MSFLAFLIKLLFALVNQQFIMFGLDPFSRPVAIAEISLLLIFLAVVGWVIARLIFNKRINKLHALIALEETELDECYKGTNIH